MARRKTWREKRESTKPAIVKECPKDMMGMKAGQQMLIPSPSLIDETVRSIPRGELWDIPRLRTRLAEKSGADVSCPVTTGILLRVVLEAAHEDHCTGKTLEEITPIWRILTKDTSTYKKLSFNAELYLNQGLLERGTANF